MRTTTRTAAGPDYSYIEHLRRVEGDALGFVPKDRYLSVLERRASYGRNRFAYETIALAEDNGEPTGFCYAAFSARTGVAKVYQVVVQQDARRWHRALLLLKQVEAEAERRGLFAVEARVAVDLEANLFWRSAGYEAEGTTTATFLARDLAASGRALFVYRKTLANPLQPELWGVLTG